MERCAGTQAAAGPEHCRVYGPVDGSRWTLLTLAGPHLPTPALGTDQASLLSQGCIVIRYTAPWHMVFFSESLGIPSLRVLAQKLLELLFDYEVEKEPLLFHVFSNAGVMLYRHVLELLEDQSDIVSTSENYYTTF